MTKEEKVVMKLLLSLKEKEKEVMKLLLSLKEKEKEGEGGVQNRAIG